MKKKLKATERNVRRNLNWVWRWLTAYTVRCGIGPAEPLSGSSKLPSTTDLIIDVPDRRAREIIASTALSTINRLATLSTRRTVPGIYIPPCSPRAASSLLLPLRPLARLHDFSQQAIPPASQASSPTHRLARRWSTFTRQLSNTSLLFHHRPPTGHPWKH
jgi:hypothetical protein